MMKWPGRRRATEEEASPLAGVEQTRHEGATEQPVGARDHDGRLGRGHVSAIFDLRGGGAPRHAFCPVYDVASILDAGGHRATRGERLVELAHEVVQALVGHDLP